MRSAVRTALLHSAPFQPLDLGTKLVDYWDAERADTMTLVGSAVSSWRSVKSGMAAGQAISSARPVISASGFNGRAGVVFDGSDDELTVSGVGSFPIGSSPCEMWVLVDQTALPADATTRIVFAYGAGTTVRRRIYRNVLTATNRAGVGAGDGVDEQNVGNLATDFSGRHVVRATVNSSAQVDVDGVAGSMISVTPSTQSTRVRLGAGSSGSALNFFKGAMNFVAVTQPLSNSQAAQMLAYLKSRGGIA